MGTGGGAATAGPARAPGRRGRRGAAMTSSRTSPTPAAPDPARIGDRRGGRRGDRGRHDQSDARGYYALQWTLLHFFSLGQLQQYRLLVVTAKPTAASAVSLVGPGYSALQMNKLGQV